LTPLRGARILWQTSMGWSMDSGDSPAAEDPEMEDAWSELEEALARLRGVTEELPPLDELAALQAGMAGLAQMGAILQAWRRSSRESADPGEKPADEDGS
jgi:hypothetical protein